MLNDLTVTLKIDGKRYKIPVLEITTYKTPLFDEMKIRFARKNLPPMPLDEYRTAEIVGNRHYKNRRVSAWIGEWDDDQIITMMFDGPRQWRKERRRWTTQIYKKFFMTR